MWEIWKTENLKLGNVTEESLPFAKYVFYTAGCHMYNQLISVIRADHSLKAFSLVTEAMRQNLNMYFESIKPNTIN